MKASRCAAMDSGDIECGLDKGISDDGMSKQDWLCPIIWKSPLMATINFATEITEFLEILLRELRVLCGENYFSASYPFFSKSFPAKKSETATRKGWRLAFWASVS